MNATTQTAAAELAAYAALVAFCEDTDNPANSIEWLAEYDRLNAAYMAARTPAAEQPAADSWGAYFAERRQREEIAAAGIHTHGARATLREINACPVCCTPKPGEIWTEWDID